MEVNIYGRNIKVTERLEEYVNDKVQKFAQLGDNVKDIDVKFSKDGHLGGESIRVEITVVGTGPVLRSEARVTTSSRSSMKPTASSWSVCAVHVTAASCTSAVASTPSPWRTLPARFPWLPKQLPRFCCRMFRG